MKKNTLLLLISALTALLMISCPLPAPMDPSSDIILMLPPAPPKNVSSTKHMNESIEISWEESPGADGYVVMMMESNEFRNGSSRPFSSASGKPQGGVSVLRERGFQQVGECDRTQLSLKIEGDTIRPGRHYVYSVVAYRNFGSIQKFSDRSGFAEGGTMGVISSINKSVDPTSVSVSWDVPSMKSVLDYENGMPKSLYEHYSFIISFREVKPNATEVQCAEIREGEPLIARIPIKGTDINGAPYELRPSRKADKNVPGSKDEIIRYSFSVTMYVYADAEHSGAPIGISPKSEELILEIMPTEEAPQVEDLGINAEPLAESIDIRWTEPVVVGIPDYRGLYRIERQEEGSGEWTAVLSEFDRQDAVKREDDGSCSFSDRTAPINKDIKYRVTFGYTYPSGQPDETDPIVMGGAGEETRYQHRIWLPTDVKVTSFERGAAGDNSREAEVTLEWTFPGSPEELRAAEWRIVTKRWSANHGTHEEGFDRDPVITVPQITAGENSRYSAKFSVTTDSADYQQMYCFALSYKKGDASVLLDAELSDGIVPQLGGFNVKVLFEDLMASSNRIGEVKLTWKNIDASRYDRWYVFKVGDDVIIEDLPNEYITVNEETGECSAVLQVGIDLPEDRTSWDIRMTVYDGIKQGGHVDPNIPAEREYTNLMPVKGTLLSVPVIEASQGTSSEFIEVSVKNADSADTEVEYEIEYAPKGSADDAFRPVPNDGSGWKLPAGEGNSGEIMEFRAKARNTDQTEVVYTDYSEKAEGAVFGGAGIEITASRGTDPKNVEISFTPALGADHYIVRRRTIVPEGPDAAFYAAGGETGEWGEVIEKKMTKLSFRDNIYDYALSAEENQIALSDKYEYMIIPVNADGVEADIATCMGSVTSGWLFMPPREIRATKGWSMPNQDGNTFSQNITLSWTAVEDATAYTVQPYTYRVETEYPEEGGDPVKTLVPEYNTNNVKVFTVEALGEPVEGKYSVTMPGNKEGMFYAIKSVSSGTGLESLFQTRFHKDWDEVGNELPSNFGYSYDDSAIDNFTAVTASHGKGAYKDWIELSWKRTRGSYRYELNLPESANPLILDVSVLDVDVNSLKPVEKAGTPNAPGYLTYDRETDVFTYYDDSGLMDENLFISSYTLKGINRNGLGTQNTPNAGDSRLYRQFKPEEAVNIMNRVMRVYIGKADDQFGGDWWSGELSTREMKEDGVLIRAGRSKGGTYDYPNNFTEFRDHTDSWHPFVINTTVNILNVASDGAGLGHLGKDPLDYIGHEGNGTVTMHDPSGLYEDYEITYDHVSNNPQGGRYTVKKGSNTVTIDDNESLARPVI